MSPTASSPQSMYVRSNKSCRSRAMNERAPLATDSDRLARIRATLEATFAPCAIVLEDQSHLHRGHAGARGGMGHFALHIVAEQFAGRAPLARHRLIYAALAALMETDIHALSINALCPTEAASRSE